VVQHEAMTLLPTLESVWEGRDLVRRLTKEWQLSELEDVAVLLTSEALTNAIRHAGTAVRLDVFAGEGLLVWVTDSDAAPVPTSWAADSDSAAVPTSWAADSGGTDEPGSDLPSEHGRGLSVIAAVADRWGIDPRPDGKTLWFAFDRPTPRADPSN
jgi:hypothetical protein